MITVHLTANAIDRDTADELLDTLEKELRNRVSDNIVGIAGETPVSALSRELRRAKASLVIVDMASSGQIVVALARKVLAYHQEYIQAMHLLDMQRHTGHRIHIQCFQVGA